MLPIRWTENARFVEVLLAEAEQVRLRGFTVIVVENVTQQARGSPGNRVKRAPVRTPCLS